MELNSTPDFITPKEQVVHNDFPLSQKENINSMCVRKNSNNNPTPAHQNGFQHALANFNNNLRQKVPKVFSPGRLTPQRVKRHRNAFNHFTLTASQTSTSPMSQSMNTTIDAVDTNDNNTINSSQSSEISGGDSEAVSHRGVGDGGGCVSSFLHKHTRTTSRFARGTNTSTNNNSNGTAQRQRYSLLKRRVRSPPVYKNPFECIEESEIRIGSQEKSGDSNSSHGNARQHYNRFGGGSSSGNVCTAHSLLRMRVDFKEICEVGRGNFSKVVKVVHRLDGCAYAVKIVQQRILSECDLKQILLEVQSFAIVQKMRSHPNIVQYYSSWIESERLHVQMELCESTLIGSKEATILNDFNTADNDSTFDENTVSEELGLSQSNISMNCENFVPLIQFSEQEVICVLREIGSALQHVHEMGIAHLDVKPDNIYVGMRGEYKLGDFGRAARMDCATIIQEGDSRYMPREIMNDDYSCLDKADIFSLGVTALEMLTGGLASTTTSLNCKGSFNGDTSNGNKHSKAMLQYEVLRETGKIPLLPAISVHLQRLIAAMCSCDARQRPSALEMLSYAILKVE